jgi:hypothetical protein
MKLTFLRIVSILNFFFFTFPSDLIAGEGTAANAFEYGLSGLNINARLNGAFLNSQETMNSARQDIQERIGSSGLKKVIDEEQLLITCRNLSQLNPQRRMINDTLVVGILPGDTLHISGSWSNNGPVIVLQDGVLIFDHANAIIHGDLFVLGRGQVLADSSTLFFPQQYFYHRGILITDTSVLNIQNSTIDFGGMSHSFVALGNSEAVFQNVHHADWTTAGIYGHANVFCDGNNLGGEYICTEYSTVHFRNTSTLLVWHHLPDTAIVQHEFPAGAIVPSYTFNNLSPGVQGVGYSVQLDSCSDVMWAIMPENGSDVTLSNSTIRAIGLWFNRGDSTSVSGLVNNSNYTNFTAPLSDRNLNLVNSQLQTWSVYLFDSSQVSISGCVLGEVGAMGTSLLTANGFYCDGSGGYFWASETGIGFASNVSVGSIVRSEKRGIMVFAYGSVNNSGAAAVGNSLLVVVQSSLPSDPVAYDASTVWYLHVDAPSTTLSYTDTIVQIPGSAWIDHGPYGSFMQFNKYGVYYQVPNSGSWIPIDTGITTEVRNGILANWNTHGLTHGSYLIRLSSFNDLGDSIEAIRQVTLLPIILDVQEDEAGYDISVFPNPSSGLVQVKIELKKAESITIELMDITGKVIGIVPEALYPKGVQLISMNTLAVSSGLYFVQIKMTEGRILKRLEMIN